MRVFCNLVVSRKSLVVSLLVFLFFVCHSFALSPEAHLSEPEEQRARELFLQIKCPVCAGQVIESSNTEIAFQLRKLVREKIVEGKSDEEIKAYLITEYGEDILNSPNFNWANIWLWILPALFVVGGVWLLRKVTLSS
ncbi:MAG: cytochrome c-type biogenesis protein [Pseudomonadota bacterium]